MYDRFRHTASKPELADALVEHPAVILYLTCIFVNETGEIIVCIDRLIGI